MRGGQTRADSLGALAGLFHQCSRQWGLSLASRGFQLLSAVLVPGHGRGQRSPPSPRPAHPGFLSNAVSLQRPRQSHRCLEGQQNALQSQENQQSTSAKGDGVGSFHRDLLQSGQAIGLVPTVAPGAALAVLDTGAGDAS